jgi:hypothetical protein
MDPTKEQHQIFRKSQEKCYGDPTNDWTSIRGRKHEPYRESPNSPRPIKARQVKGKVKSILIIFFELNGNVHKEFELISHTIVRFYGDCMKMCEDFAPNFGDEITGCCITTTHRLTLPLSPGNF